MDVVIELLAAFARVACVPLTGYAVVRLARRWPEITLLVLLSLIAVGVVAEAYATYDGYRVDLKTRIMDFESDLGHWCFAGGGLLLILSVPALPLVAIARARQGTDMGPVGAQWAGVLFGYFMACFFVSAALYSWLTGIIK
jgi:hypothetical protein